MRDLKNYLGDSNITLSSEIMTFITSNCNLDKTRKEKIESMSPEDLKLIDVTIGETDF